MKKQVNITDWEIVTDFSDMYCAPECRKSFLRGWVDGHPDFEEKARVQTSHIERLDWENKIVETQNTIYILTGEPEEHYAAFLKKEQINEAN
jgi:hypothetical protein